MAKRLIQDSLDSEVMDSNTCWMYQQFLERMIVRYLPDPRMNGGALAMVQALGRQARRVAEEEDGRE